MTDHSPDGREHPQPGPRVRRRRHVPRAGVGPPAPSPTWTRRTNGCGSVTVMAPAGRRATAADRRRRPAVSPQRHGGLGATRGRRVGARGARGPPGGPGSAGAVASWRCRRGRRDPCETTLLDGHDFFGAPRVHPAGDRLAVVAWDHPDMPWDASSVVVLPLTAGRRHRARRTTCSSPPGRRGRSPAAPRSRSGSRPGSATARCVSCRTGAAGGSPTSTPATRRAPRAGAADRRGGRVPRARTGCSARRPWPSCPTARSWPRA